MITPSDKYTSLLYAVQNPNRQTDIIPHRGFSIAEADAETLFKPNTYYIEKDGKYIKAKTYDKNAIYYHEPIYEVDLNKRSIEAPEFLSVELDHNAETIYFSVDRFFDNVDLSTVYCVIQYQNANPDKAKGGYIYPVPYFDITTKARENKMLFQWAIEGPATAFSGTVTFSIKFYRIAPKIVYEADGSQHELMIYEYILNTQPQTSKVLYGLDVQATSENYYFEASEVEKIYQRIEEVRRTNDLYWIVLSDDGLIDPNDPDYPANTINKNDTITNIIG